MKKQKLTSIQTMLEFNNIKKQPDISEYEEKEIVCFENYNGKLLIQDDNFNALKNLLNNGYKGKVDLVYIDPPFGINKRFENKKSGYYFDDKIIGIEYLQFMYERLILLRELLSDEGSIYLHCDWHKSHHLRFLLDEVFGEENFVNEVVWKYFMGGKSKDFFARKHDNIFVYAKNISECKFDVEFAERILPYKPSFIDENSTIKNELKSALFGLTSSLLTRALDLFLKAWVDSTASSTFMFM